MGRYCTHIVCDAQLKLLEAVDSGGIRINHFNSILFLNQLYIFHAFSSNHRHIYILAGSVCKIQFTSKREKTIFFQ